MARTCGYVSDVQVWYCASWCRWHNNMLAPLKMQCIQFSSKTNYQSSQNFFFKKDLDFHTVYTFKKYFLENQYLLNFKVLIALQIYRYFNKTSYTFRPNCVIRTSNIASLSTTESARFNVRWAGGTLKFIYSEKAPKFCEIFPLLLTVCTAVKIKGKISQNFVAFSEYTNFKTLHQAAARYAQTNSISKFLSKLV